MERINIDTPRFDQSTFEGRLKYFFATANILNVLTSEAKLLEAKAIVDSYRKGEEDKNLSEDDLWRAKELYDSAFHPETGELMFLMGRMSFQVPGNMLISGGMLSFYKTTPAVMLWQFINQAFNAGVNYTNRNASASITTEQLGIAFAAAAGASVGTALALNKFVMSRPALVNGIVGRIVPFLAVAAANCVNIPLMRSQELREGIMIGTADGQELGRSSSAAVTAISQVIPSRILMSVPGLIVPALVLKRLERTSTYIKHPWLRIPTAIVVAGVCQCVATPFCCALFPQRASIQVHKLESHLQQTIEAQCPGLKEVFFNKGL